MGVFDSKVQLALRLIKKYGEPSTWVDRTTTPVDPATPWIPTGETDTPYSNIPIVYLKVGTRYLELLQMIVNSDVPTGAQRGLMAATAFVPKINSVVHRPSADRQYKVKSIDTIAPNGQIILYQIEFFA